jgi:hypothetical protein
MKFFLVLISVAFVGEFTLVGRVTGAEVILAGCAVVALSHNERPGHDVKRFYLLAALWLASAIAADFYNRSAFDDAARGWAKVVFLCLNFTAIRYLVGRDIQRIAFLIVTLSVATAVRIAFGVTAVAEQLDFVGAWKFGYGELASVSALYVASIMMTSLRLRAIAIGLPVVAGTVALLLNARSLAGVTVLAGLVGSLTAGRRRTLSVPFMIALGVAAVLAGVVIINVYEYAAGEGLLGLEAHQKYIQQTQGDLNLLASGRTEWLASIQAVIDSPILGHGSWAHDITYVILMMDRMEAAGLEVVREGIVSDLIPSHSHLIGAWVEHGILGAAFWCWVFWVTLTGLWAAVRRPTPLTGFMTFIGISLIWDILFSPFGLERRLVTPAWLYLMILAKEQPAVASQAKLAAWDRPPVSLCSPGVPP